MDVHVEEPRQHVHSPRVDDLRSRGDFVEDALDPFTKDERLALRNAVGQHDLAVYNRLHPKIASTNSLASNGCRSSSFSPKPM